MDTYKAGTTVKITATIKDADGELLDPDSFVVTVQENDSDTPVVDEAAMIKDSTGVYYYNYQSLTTTPAGRYNEIVKIVKDGYTSIKEAIGAFSLKS